VQVLPPLAILAATTLVRLGRREVRVALAAALVLPGLVWLAALVPMSNAQRSRTIPYDALARRDDRIAAAIDAETTPADKIYVLESEAYLYFAAQRPASYRYLWGKPIQKILDALPLMRGMLTAPGRPTLVILDTPDPAVVDPTGAALGLIVFVMRMWIPESPRWLMIHGQPEEAHRIVDDIERSATGQLQDPRRHAWPKVRLKMRDHTPLREVANTLFSVYRQRSLVGLALMVAQAFFYNAIFFTFALVLTDFFGIASNQVGWYILPFAAGNFLGPLLLGRLFDTLGRRAMITFTYGVSGVLLALSGYLFSIGALTAQTQTIAWMVIFFFASPAASAAYLTVSETFPLEVRALAIALFYAVGTGIGGVAGPALFGALVDTGSRNSVFAGYLFGASLMIAAAVIAWRYAIAAERRPLESVAPPLAFVE